jgi:hypothetical protein
LSLINHETVVDLFGNDVSAFRFNRRRKLDLVFVPRLDHDRAGDIPQLDANILSRRIVFGELLLRVNAE